jgi:integrative and conjugative element protein (TIGR02256 family)
VNPVGLTSGQQLALTQLEELVELSDGAIQLLARPDADIDGYWRPVVSLDFSGLSRTSEGIRVRARERFKLVVPTDFPFAIPHVWVPHDRWAGVPHVQWRQHLCLFGAPSIEWDPADGMNLLVDRIRLWVEAAAIGQLDPDDQPLHPPVAYRVDPGVVVVRAEIGDLAPAAAGTRRDLLSGGASSAGADAQLVVGVAAVREADRLDIVRWVPHDEWLSTWTEYMDAGTPVRACLGVLAATEATFEYPERAADVVRVIDTLGVTLAQFFRAAALVAVTNTLLRHNHPLPRGGVADRLHVLIGTPSRRSNDGTLRQHLICWRFDERGDDLTADLHFLSSSNEALAAAADEAIGGLVEWITTTNAGWVSVLDDRSEVTVRRDTGTASAWLRGRRIAIFGAGALGGNVAEMCVRGGASEVVIVDNDIVTPGILVRQPFEDQDIGRNKAVTIAARLNRVRDGVVSGYARSAQATFLTNAEPPAFDLVIDAAADHGLRCRIERHAVETQTPWPPLLTLVVGHDAARGVVAMSARDGAAAGHDLLRRLALDARSGINPALDDVAKDLFPVEPRTDQFHPEPGCSAPTFVGSSAQMAALAGGLLDAGLRLLADAEIGGASTSASVVRIPQAAPGTVTTSVAWESDLLVVDQGSGYSVRIAAAALAIMRSEVRRGRRLRGPKVETGGTLVGQIDDAARCIWIDHASGPPPDSLLSELFFDHGTDGVEEYLAHRREASGRLSTYLGMWHSHPCGRATPSELDERAMSDLVAPFAGGPRRALIVIIGGSRSTWDDWVDGQGEPDVFAALLKATDRDRVRADRRGHRPSRSSFPPEAARGIQVWEAGWRQQPQPSRRRRLRLRRTRRPTQPR